MTSTLAKGLACKGCVEIIKETVAPAEQLSFYDQVEFVKSFCYLGDIVNACSEK